MTNCGDCLFFKPGAATPQLGVCRWAERYPWFPFIAPLVRAQDDRYCPAWRPTDAYTDRRPRSSPLDYPTEDCRGPAEVHSRDAAALACRG